MLQVNSAVDYRHDWAPTISYGFVCFVQIVNIVDTIVIIIDFDFVDVLSRTDCNA
ncbi:hypothetical protein GGS23DRAFT_597210 [Durotheca rogersii]|uniref:uncharacterized protein n=1 Tax=Durotheca rogersii TaxID=419775 RepID=UPI00221E3B27|nr:uncharacterized protein GGS23DRAFT_597210 [Durotheca rogersii]KAI5862904.1 hypothetical protein GGS23DRAFT_597210 [Durotheca rogersii]